MASIKVAHLGEVVGRSGRKALFNFLSNFEEQDFLLLNAENAAGGFGLTPRVAEEFFSWGIDCLTLGNHAWSKKEGVEIIANDPRILRPANYPSGVPGRGANIFNTKKGVKIGVINLMGRIFMEPLDSPFSVGERIVEEMRKETPIIIVDFHAEATSEKEALANFLDGKVSAVIGTHTHVQTADERLLPGGTAFITDIGMTGPINSIIGVKKEQVLHRFLHSTPTKFEVAEGPAVVCVLFMEIDAESGKAVSLKRVRVCPSDE
ncbi:TIGR00282 family metallophosphoesterase [bacterium]|nr:TIGR00282 family metallophosphoesterase [bacterium]